MRNLRLIARLDIKGPNLIKGVHLEGLRVMGDPQDFAGYYYESGVDEIIYMDIVASLYGRNNLHDVIRRTAQNIFVPLTVGGGVRSVDDAYQLLRSGADKIALNTAAIKRPELIRELAERFGSQCVVLSIEAKSMSPGKWEAYTDNGRESTGKDVVEWAKLGTQMGAGEILLTSVDNEGTRQGFDVSLVKSVVDVVQIPVIASGGMGNPQHLVDVVQKTSVDAVAMADCLHFKRHTLPEIRAFAQQYSLAVRRV